MCILFGGFKNSLYLCKRKQETNKNNNNNFSPRRITVKRKQYGNL